jgi:hypothetical protein
MKNGKSGNSLPHLENTLVLQSIIEGMTPAQVLARDQMVAEGASNEEANKAVLEAEKAVTS